jgi:hypothetical protein
MLNELNHSLVIAQAAPDVGAGGAAAGGLFMLIQLALIVGFIAGMWKTFVKAGKPGWGAIIPIYNVILLLEIAGRPLWWILLFLIPFVNFIVFIIVSMDVARNFGKGAGFGLGLALLGFIFYPILGFGDAKYQGSAQPAS